MALFGLGSLCAWNGDILGGIPKLAVRCSPSQPVRTTTTPPLRRLHDSVLKLTATVDMHILSTSSPERMRAYRYWRRVDSSWYAEFVPASSFLCRWILRAAPSIRLTASSTTDSSSNGHQEVTRQISRTRHCACPAVDWRSNGQAVP